MKNPQKQPFKKKGRATFLNPKNRFLERFYEEEPWLEEDRWEEEEQKLPSTEIVEDQSNTILSQNSSPDTPYTTTLNPYRGCEHGCIYCYARPYHEYLGFSCGLDFETKILVKKRAPHLLYQELNSPKWIPRPVLLSGATDPYQPLERKLKLTRRCLEVMVQFRNPVSIITKNYLVTRDLDLLQELSRFQAVRVNISVTTLDMKLAALLEPRTSRPPKRLLAIRRLSEAHIPVGVMVAPIIPGLTDHEVLPILEAAREAGAQYAGYTILRLPYQVADLFKDWLEAHYPDRKKKILNRLKAVREGSLNSSEFGIRMKGKGVFARLIQDMFEKGCRKLELSLNRLDLSCSYFKRPGDRQKKLFD